MHLMLLMCPSHLPLLEWHQTHQTFHLRHLMILQGSLRLLPGLPLIQHNPEGHCYRTLRNQKLGHPP